MTTIAKTSTLITDQQKDKVADLGREACKAAVGKVNPTNDNVQKGVIEQGGEFKRRVQEAVEAIILDMTTPNKYADQVTESTSTYPKEYKGPKTIQMQIAMVSAQWGLDAAQALAYAENLPELPEGAEGWFAIPRTEAIAAKLFPHVTDPIDRYCQAVNTALAKLDESRSFTNYRKGEIDKKHLRGNARTIEKFGEVKQQQQGDIIIIAAQLGFKHRGESVNRAREIISSTANEYGLGALAVICIALTHPERFVMWEQLHIDCAGDEFAPDGDGVFSGAPVLGFDDGGLGFVASGVSNTHGHYGSASGFVPQ